MKGKITTELFNEILFANSTNDNALKDIADFGERSPEEQLAMIDKTISNTIATGWQSKRDLLEQLLDAKKNIQQLVQPPKQEIQSGPVAMNMPEVKAKKSIASKTYSAAKKATSRITNFGIKETSRGVKAVLRGGKELVFGKTDYSKVSTTKLIELLTHSTPNSDRSNKVLKAIEAKIQKAEKSGNALELEMLQQKFAGREKAAVYGIGSTENILTAAARYGHQDVVNKLLDKFPALKESTRKDMDGTIHKASEYIGEDNKITVKPLQRKFYNVEKAAIAAAVAGASAATYGAAAAPIMAVLAPSVGVPALGPAIAAGVAQLGAVTGITGAAGTAIASVTGAASTAIAGATTAWSTAATFLSYIATAAGANTLGLVGVGAGEQVIGGAVMTGTAGGLAVTGVGIGAAKVVNTTRRGVANAAATVVDKFTTKISTESFAKVDDIENPIHASKAPAPENGVLTRGENGEYKIGKTIVVSEKLNDNKYSFEFGKIPKGENVTITTPRLDKDGQVANPPVLDIITFNDKGKLVAKECAKIKEGGELVKLPLNSPQVLNTETALDKKWINGKIEEARKDMKKGNTLPRIDSLVAATQAHAQTGPSVISSPTAASANVAKGNGSIRL